MTSREKKELLIRYLTGSLPPDESLRLEEEYLENEALYQELLDVETDLIDSYARGELTGANALSLQSHFAPHEFRQRLLFSRALTQRIQASQVRPAPDASLPRRRQLFTTSPFGRRLAWRFVPATAVLLGAIVALVLLTRRPGPIGPTARQSFAPAGHQQSAPISTPALSIVLLPGQRSNEEANTVKLPVPGNKLRLELVLPQRGMYDSYSVTVRAVGRAWSQRFQDLAVQTKASGEPELVLELPTANLPSDDYTASISGIRQGREEEFAGYTFRLISH